MNTYNFSDLSVGFKKSFHVTLTEEMMKSFLTTTGDNNSLHLNADYAKSKGFEGRVVYGMLIASFYSTLIGVYLPGEKALFQSINTTFNLPVYIEQELIIEGEVVYTNEAFKQIEVAATVSSPEGKIFSKAKIKVGILE